MKTTHTNNYDHTAESLATQLERGLELLKQDNGSKKTCKKENIMRTIKDHQLFEELKKDTSWEVLFDDDYNLKNPNIPVLFGGLDHISKTRKYFYFHDIGCNGRDNSFRIGRER